MTVYEINEYVEKHRNEAIQFLTELLQTPSPTGEEVEISKLTKQWMEKDGLDVKVHGVDESHPNLIAQWEGGPGPRFMFNGHYDVFPPVADENSRDPWSGEIADGNIYGRGAADMKAGLAAGIMAVKLLKRSGFVPKGSVIISCDCDEERGGKLGARYLIAKGLLDADFGVCMEASEKYVIVDSDGVISMKVTYHSESWHAGMRMEIPDALRKAHRAIEKLYQYDKMLQDERSFRDSGTGAILSITAIHAAEGDASNMHPSVCTFSIDRRYTAGETPESAISELKAVLDALKAEDASMEYDLEVLTIGEQIQMDPESPCIKAAIKYYRDFFHKEITPGRRCGGGDTAKITTAYGYPLPQLGPGKFDQLCAVDEHVSIQEYINFIKVYMGMVVELLGK